MPSFGTGTAVDHVDADHLQGDGAAGFVLDHFGRHDIVQDLHAFMQGVMDFVLCGGHLVDREQRGQCHVGAFALGGVDHVLRGVAAHDQFGTVLRIDLVDMAETTRHGGDVDGGVATADADHLAVDALQAAVIEGGQEGHAGDAVLGVGAGHRQRTADVRADGPEQRVIVFFQLFDADVAADAGVHAHLDTQVEDAVDFAVQHLTRGTITRDAVAHHAAEFFVVVEHGGAMTHAAQLIGRGQSRRDRRR